MRFSSTGLSSGRAAGFEWPLTLLCLGLTGIGLAVIYSATGPMGAVGRTLFLKQVTWCAFGLVMMSALLLFDYHLLERYGIWLYAAIIVALLAAWTLGRVTAGSKRWLEIGFMRFQPSEFAKLAVVLVLAKIFSSRSMRGGLELKELVFPALAIAAPVLLTLIQPDLGTAGVIILIGASMTLFAGVSKRALLWIGGTLVVVLPVLALIGDRFLMDYQKKRLLTFLNPDYDPLGAGYHIIQSQIAIGAGGLWGEGFLKGTQNQLMFLPVKHTDFVFSVFAEEWGFVGSLVVLVLFGAFLMQGLAVSSKARDDFGAYTAFGCTMLILWHVSINIGMVMGLLPVVGVPLTFMSYGGSSILASFLAVSLMVNISMRRFSF